MNEYDFSTLNDKEFEVLCQDLLTVELQLNLQSFRSGKDKGVDLRFSTNNNNNDLVVQVKHYVKSSFSQLKQTCIKENGKVKQLNPNRYIFCTSQPLSPQNKDELESIFSPYIQNSNDIYGREDLNKILRNNPNLERKYFKLWFSNISILDKILNNAIDSRSQYYLKNIKNKIQLFVETKNYNKAIKILNDNKMLLISGQPGIGKTTLSDMIILNSLKKEMKFYYVYSIKEAEENFDNRDDISQLFYIDDFLGSNYLDFINMYRDNELTNFVNRFSQYKNKYLILTTRTVILNQALNNFEKLNFLNIQNEKVELVLEDYNRFEKGQILYNHMYFNNLTPEYYEVILKERFYLDIIKHKNYTPRIIEFITDKNKISGLSLSDLKNLILENLNNPSDIWKHHFEKQISDFDRFLIFSLFLNNDFCNEDDLRLSFNNRISYEIKRNNVDIKSNQFENSIRNLLEGFITSTIEFNNSRILEFINPSLTDFIINYLNTYKYEYKVLIEISTNIYQLKILLNEKFNTNLNKEIKELIIKKVKDYKLNDIENENDIIENNLILIKSILVLVDYCDKLKTDNLICELFSKIKFDSNVNNILLELDRFLLLINDFQFTKVYIDKNFNNIIESIIHSVDYKFEIENILIYFSVFNRDYHEFISGDHGFYLITTGLERFIYSKMEYIINEKSHEVFSDYAIENLSEELEEIKSDYIDFLNLDINLDYYSHIDLFSYDWEEIKKENFQRDQLEEMQFDEYKESREAVKDLDQEIINLFEK